MDDTLWVWVICEPFLPLETNESTNYLIMISVTWQTDQTLFAINVVDLAVPQFFISLAKFKDCIT